MVDMLTHKNRLLTAEWELEHTTSQKRRRDLKKYIGRLHKERSECMKHLRGEYGKRAES